MSKKTDKEGKCKYPFDTIHTGRKEKEGITLEYIMRLNFPLLMMEKISAWERKREQSCTEIFNSGIGEHERQRENSKSFQTQILQGKWTRLRPRFQQQCYM